MIIIEPKPSRSLRKSELKPLLVRQMKEQPDFRFLTFATGVFYFQRKRSFRNYELKEMLHLVYSFTDHTMQASISSRLNPVHTLNPIYNNGLINPHVDLKTLKGSNVIPGNASYSCNGRIDSVREMVKAMVDDFSGIGITWFDQRLKSLESDPMINTGLDFIEDWDFDKTMLGNELQLQLRKAKFRFDRVRHPLINQFKHQLESIGGQSREARQEIPRLAFDLAELYCNRRIAAY